MAYVALMAAGIVVASTLTVAGVGMFAAGLTLLVLYWWREHPVLERRRTPWPLGHGGGPDGYGEGDSGGFDGGAADAGAGGGGGGGGGG